MKEDLANEIPTPPLLHNTVTAPTESGRTTSDEVTQIRMTRAFKTATITAKDFIQRDIPKREVLLSPFLLKGDYGIIFAPRGVGKSWLALMMCKAISDGEKVGNHWSAPTPQRTLYVDAEMNLPDLQGRCKQLNIESDSFLMLSHEQLFTESNDSCSMNFADKRQQEVIMNQCIESDVSLLVIDNLSTAFHGLEENKADSWEEVSPWLLELRRRGVSVVLVCHAGRNGNIRGTSKREDMAHWILSVEECDDKGECSHAFKTKFTKCRNVTALETPSLEWSMIYTDEETVVATKEIDLRAQMVEMIVGGITSNKELCDALGKGKGTITKWAKKAAEEGKIKIQSGKYLPV
ncbi:AAA family ATPase [Rubritalea marina]|uniref:AAA family ATPase n=1 Tax=Rubritalea marina TaxID=361055 RepID=UPI0014614886|nr:AAA family ATPase [Rubritalea marina]